MLLSNETTFPCVIVCPACRVQFCCAATPSDHSQLAASPPQSHDSPPVPPPPPLQERSPTTGAVFTSTKSPILVSALAIVGLTSVCLLAAMVWLMMRPVPYAGRGQGDSPNDSSTVQGNSETKSGTPTIVVAGVTDRAGKAAPIEESSPLTQTNSPLGIPIVGRSSLRLDTRFGLDGYSIESDKEAIAAMALSRNGKRLVVGTGRGEGLIFSASQLRSKLTAPQIHLIDVEKSRVLQCWQGEHPQLSGDGKKLVFFEPSGGGMVVCDTETGKSVQKTPVEAADALVAVSNNGSKVAMLRQGRSSKLPAEPSAIEFVDLTSGTSRVILITIGSADIGQTQHAKLVKVALSHDSTLLATSTNSGDVALWSLKDGKELASRRLFSEGAVSLRFSPQYDLLLAVGQTQTSGVAAFTLGTRDGLTKSYDLRVPERVGGPRAQIRDAGFLDSAAITLEQVDAGGQSSTRLTRWNTEIGEAENVVSLPATVASLEHLDVSQLTALVTKNEGVVVARLMDQSGRVATPPLGTFVHPASVRVMQFTQDGTRLVCGGGGVSGKPGGVATWKVEKGTKHTPDQVVNDQGLVDQLLIDDKAGSIVAVLTEPGGSRWDLNKNDARSLSGPRVLALGSSPWTGRIALIRSAGKDGLTLSLKDGIDDSRVVEFSLPPYLKQPKQLLFSPEGNVLALLAGDKGSEGVWLLDTKAGSFEQIPDAKSTAGLAWSRDGRTILLANRSVVQWWDVKRLRLTDQRQEVHHSVQALAADAQGKLLAVGGVQDLGDFRAAVVSLWDMDLGRVRRTLVAAQQADTSSSAHEIDVTSLVFSPGGEHLALATNDGAVRVWEVASVLASQPETSIPRASAPLGKIVRTDPVANLNEYQGKPLDYWLRTLQVGNRNDVREAVTALSTIRNPALLGLRKLLKALNPMSERDRIHAVLVVLFNMGPAAKEAALDVAEFLPAQDATETLAGMGPDIAENKVILEGLQKAMEKLATKDLKNRNAPNEGNYAAIALSRLGEKGHAVLVNALGNPHPGLRCDAYVALCKSPLNQEHAAATVPGAVRLLRAPASPFKDLGLQVVQHIGPAAAPAAKDLANIMITDPYLRNRLTDVLVNLGPKAAEATTVLKNSEGDNDQAVRQSVFRTLKAIGTLN